MAKKGIIGNKWTAEEIEILRQNYAKYGITATAALLPRHPYDSVRTKAYLLGITKQQRGRDNPCHRRAVIAYTDDGVLTFPNVPAAANSVTSVAKDSMIVEPAILQQQRTEEGKEIRRQHKSDKGIPYAHKELTPRGDGITNTLSTFDHDNLLAEPAVLGWTRSGDSKGEPTYHPVEVANCVTAAKRDNTQNYVVEPTRQDLIQYHLTDDGNLRAYIDDEKKTGVSELQITNPDNPAPTLTVANHAKVWQSIEEIIEQAKTAHPSRGIIMIKNTPCWVRRLSERELFRLMDVDEPDIDTLLNAGISNTQLAKLAGNSVVCACYYHIFRKLFIDTNANVNEQLQLF